jgi:hypothetical protein
MFKESIIRNKSPAPIRMNSWIIAASSMRHPLDAMGAGVDAERIL